MEQICRKTLLQNDLTVNLLDSPESPMSDAPNVESPAEKIEGYQSVSDYKDLFLMLDSEGASQRNAVKRGSVLPLG